MLSAETDREFQSRLTVFRHALQKLGWTEGRNVSIDVHWAGGSLQRIQEAASEFASLAPDVVLCSGSVATAAMKRDFSVVGKMVELRWLRRLSGMTPPAAPLLPLR